MQKRVLGLVFVLTILSLGIVSAAWTFQFQDWFKGLIDNKDVSVKELKQKDLSSSDTISSAQKNKNSITGRVTLTATDCPKDICKGLVAWYKGDGNALDYSGNENDGVSEGNVSYVDGKFGKAFSFNKPKGHIATQITPSKAFTWSLWVKASSYPYNYQSMMTVIWAGTGGFLFDLYGPDLSFWTGEGYGGQNFGVMNLPKGEWYHLALVRGGDTLDSGYKLYLNGEFKKSYPSYTWSPAGKIWIGERADYREQPFIGQIDEVAVYDRALTEEEIKALANPSASCTESWTCSEWGNCVNEQQTRECKDLNSCGTTKNKPNTLQSCTIVTQCNSDQYGEAGSLCYNKYKRGCSSKLDHVVAAGIDKNSVDKIDVIEQGCFKTDGTVPWGDKKYKCPVSSNSEVLNYDVCVRNGNDGNGNYMYLGVMLKKNCTDSDGGRDYFVKGYLSGMNSAGGVADRESDSCGQLVGSSFYKGQGTAVLEYYCQQDGTFTTEFHECPDDCYDGACIQSTTTEVDRCPELSANLKQKITYYEDLSSPNGRNTVRVEGKEVKRLDNVVIYSNSVSVPDKGRLLRVLDIPSNSSSSNRVRLGDLISGEVFDFATGTGQKAVTNIDGQTYYLYAYNYDANDLNRYIILTWGAGSSAGNVGNERDTFNCKVTDCKDSDGGLNYFVKGTASSCSTNPSETCTGFDDKCSDNSVLKEGYCDGGSVSDKPYACENGCYDGQCIYGFNEYAEVNVGEENRVLVGNMNEGFKVYLISTSMSTSDDPNVAKFDVNGLRISVGEGTTWQLTNGYVLTLNKVFVPSLAGEVGSAVFKIGKSDVDTCVSVAAKRYDFPSAVIVTNSSGKYKLEGYCDGNYYVQAYCVDKDGNPALSGVRQAWDKQLCDEKCVSNSQGRDGACYNSSMNYGSCEDGDRGDDPYVKSSVSGIEYQSTGQATPFEKEDLCSPHGNGGIVEYVCNEYGAQSRMDSVGETCPNGCLDGACVQPEKCQKASERATLTRWNKKASFNVDGRTYDFELVAVSGSNSARISYRISANGRLYDVTSRSVTAGQTYQIDEDVYISVMDVYMDQYVTDADSYVSFVVNSECGNKKDCSGLVDEITTPIDEEVGGVKYEFRYSDRYESAYWLNGFIYNVTEVYAGWDAYSGQDTKNDPQHYSINYNVVIFNDSEVDLSQWIKDQTSYNLCQVHQIQNGYTRNNVVVCNWNALREEQDNGNYKYDSREVIWTHGNVAVRASVYSGKTLTDDEVLKLSQKRMEDFLYDLKDNRAKYIDWKYFDLEYPAQSRITRTLAECPSDVISANENENGTGVCSPSWSCKVQPAICPEYGYQTKICVDHSGCEKNREEQVYCSPGICSGCYKPRYFNVEGGQQDKMNSICIPYGTRFVYKQGEEIKIRTADLNGDGYFNLTILDGKSAIVSIVQEIPIDFEINGQKFEGKVGESLEFYEGANYDVIYSERRDYNKIENRVEVTVEEINENDGYIVLRIGKNDFKAYCNFDGSIYEQKTKDVNGNWAECQNNYECSSNVCSDGECIELKGIANEAKGMKALLVRTLCKITNMFDDSRYETCLSDFGVGATNF